MHMLHSIHVINIKNRCSAHERKTCNTGRIAYMDASSSISCDSYFKGLASHGLSFLFSYNVLILFLKLSSIILVPSIVRLTRSTYPLVINIEIKSWTRLISKTETFYNEHYLLFSKFRTIRTGINMRSHVKFEIHPA